MSNKALKYICLTISFCWFTYSISNIWKVIFSTESKVEECSENKKLEQEPINLQDLLMPKEIFPKLPLPQAQENNYAGQ